MSFWKNPENNSLKVIILLVIVFSAGYFAFENMHQSALEGKGSVISTSSTGSSTSSSSTTIPTVVTEPETSIGTIVQMKGNIASSGGAPVTARGVVVTGHTPLTRINTAGWPLGVFSINQTSIVEDKDLAYLNDLACGGSAYTYKAFATNSVGTGYGAEVDFTTPPCNAKAASGGTLTDTGAGELNQAATGDAVEGN